jgi:hypothetical protein
MAPKQIADQSGIMRDGEVAPVSTDEATASTNEVGVAVPHSPGPWRVEEPEDWPFEVGVFSAADAVVVVLTGPHSSNQKSIDDWRAGVGFKGKGEWSRESAVEAVARVEANARLIAAAPDLLAALKLLAERMELTRDYMLGNADLEDVDAVERARNAIAIAEGGH